jgi:RNA polymerase sigma factor (sigma-70 family)
MGSALPSEVWEKFVSGEISSFRKLFKAYYKGLYGYGLKISNDSCLVEDCIQDLFESVWKRREELGHITSPNVYLYVSLRRKILAVLKKKKNLKDINESVENLNIHFGTEEIIITRENHNEQRKELQKALNQLTNQQKEVIYLHFYNGMSYSEIEEILSINRQSVRNHMYRGMETLRTVLNIDVMRLVISGLVIF